MATPETIIAGYKQRMALIHWWSEPDRTEPIPPAARPDRLQAIRRDLAVLLDGLYGLHVRPGHVDLVLGVIAQVCICQHPSGLVQEWLAKAREVARNLCICEIDRHDFNCPIHNAGEPPRE